MLQLKGYKGFNKDLKCRGFQYEVGKEYEYEGEVEICKSGFHFCENPLDVFNYYAPADSRYCEVEGSGSIDRDNNDSKVAAPKIKIHAEIGICGLVDAFVKYCFKKIDWQNANESNNKDYSAAINTGDYSAATNTGDYSAATNTGNWSAATNTGNWSAATNTGDRSAATNTGYRSAATNTGNWSAATNTGDRSAATNTGYRSAATNTGDYSAATNTGNWSAASVEGAESVAFAMGIDSKAKGALGCWIVLAEWFFDDANKKWHIKTIKTAKVDGEIIKVDTYYTLKNGEFVEA